MRFNRQGFTLVELLIVIIILGVMIFLVVPSVSTGSDYARLKSASRGVVQLSRYARSMALLRQMPVDLIYSSDGTVRVAAAEQGGEKLLSQESFVRTNLVEEAEIVETPALSEPESDGGSGGAEYQMADLELEKKYDQISFKFEGYTDNMDDGGTSRKLSSAGLASNSRARDLKDEEDESTEFRIQYRTNGTCRPYRVRIVAGEDELEFKVVQVNMLGIAKVLEEDEL